MRGKILPIVLIALMATAFNPVTLKADPSPEIRVLMKDYVSVFDFYLFRVESALRNRLIERYEGIKRIFVNYDFSSDVITVEVQLNPTFERFVTEVISKYGFRKGLYNDAKKQVLHDIWYEVGRTFLMYSSPHKGYQLTNYDLDKSLKKIRERTEIKIDWIEIEGEVTDLSKPYKEKKRSFTTNIEDEKWEFKETIIEHQDVETEWKEKNKGRSIPIEEGQK